MTHVALPEGLGSDELQSIYRDPDPTRAAAIGSAVADQDAWDRVRKYAFARYWQHRIQEGSPMTAAEVDELLRFADHAFMTSVPLGVIGDAARANLLSLSQVEDLVARALNDYAARALAARRLLLTREVVSDTLVSDLLGQRAAWALHELLAGPCDDDALATLDRAATDPRLSRIERHRLREALRRRRQDRRKP